MAKKVTLSNGREWSTRSAAIEHFKKMLGKYRTGQTVDDVSDHSDLVALLKRYDQTLVPGMPSKSGAGVSHFSKQLNVGEQWATAGFHVHRIDGTSEDFSFRRAIADAQE